MKNIDQSKVKAESVSHSQLQVMFVITKTLTIITNLASIILQLP